ncbi:MAG: SLC13 family permease [Phycisphaerales bacterium]|nr:SLC13 family permease [Planctomycetota bacterium]MBL6996953.1 SLC13 family permease [Phycisphaerales bacterium]
MNFDAWFTLGTIVCIIVALMHRKKIGPDLIMAGGLVALMIVGVVNFEEATAGFAQRPLLMIAGLFVIASALQETGGIELIARKLLGKPTSLATAQFRMMVPVALMSAFMNTTPIVAMYLPMINRWSKRLNIQPSKLFMPLSFAGILGGQGTMIGTGSNLIIMGLFIGWWQNPPSWVESINVSGPSGPVAMWGAAWIGVPIAVLGITFIIITSKWLLPNREPLKTEESRKREYEIKMAIEKGAAIIGKTISDAGLRNLQGLYLYAIVREDQLLVGVTPQEVLQEKDKLVFVGDVRSVVDLRKTRGLIPANEELRDFDGRPFARKMLEAVISGGSPLVGLTVRDSQFRTTYNAAILAVHRKGEHIDGKIGDIVLRPGDTLLLESGGGFLNTWKHSPHFYLVSELDDSRPTLHNKAWISLGILALLIGLLTSGLIDRVAAIWLCGLLMVLCKCISGPVARRAINFQVLIVIGAAMGIGKAVETSGLATTASGALLDFAQNMHIGNYGSLFLVFLMTSIAAQLMTNFGAAVIMFPIVVGAAEGVGVSPYPFVFTMMAAAGCNFITPVTYQTNLMVYGPGGYKFMDFPKLGVPLTLLVAIIATIIAPQVFPFMPT